MTDLAAELRRISHDLRNSLSVLQIGAQLLERANVHGSELGVAMQEKIAHINSQCDLLTALSEKLKS